MNPPQSSQHARPRVVSLLPSATESLFAIGAGHLLVGRSHECDYPPQVQALPALTAQRTHATDPAEINRQVSAALAEGNSLYTLNEQLLAQLRPDIILTQDLCDVCSIDLRTVRALASTLTPAPAVISFNPSSLEGVLDDLLTLGRALNLEPQATHAMVALRNRLFAAEEFVNPYSDGPIVGFLEWTDPLFCAGHWNVQIIERAGGRHPLNPTIAKPNAGAAAGPQKSQRSAGKSIRIPDEVFAATRPDYLVIAPCGLDLARTRDGAQHLATKAWWPALPAVKAGRVALVDGNQMFNRPGPRLIDAFEWMVGWLNDRPELIPPSFPWQSFK